MCTRVEDALKLDPTNDEKHTRDAISSVIKCHAGLVGHLDSMGELNVLLANATRAKLIAKQAVESFDKMIFEHHEDEERELFPTVRKYAMVGHE